MTEDVSDGHQHPMELLKIEDVYTRQSLFECWLSLGTVVVSSEKTLPSVYLAGVDDPKRVMDQLYHDARKERDQGEREGPTGLIGRRADGSWKRD